MSLFGKDNPSPEPESNVSTKSESKASAGSESSLTAKELVEKIVQLLSDSPNEVVVNELAGEQVSVLEIRVAQSDTGKVIGRKGRNIQAIRTILEALGGKQGKRYSVEIIG